MPPRVKDAALVVLVLVNVILLCTVLAYVLHLPQANAQGAQNTVGGSGRFLVVSATVDSGGANALFVLDSSQERLYAWMPQRAGGNTGMMLRDTRDLRADFAKQPTPAVPPRTR
jgi:hypothetical protein